MRLTRKELAKNGFFSAFHKNGLVVEPNARPAKRKEGQSRAAAQAAIAAGHAKQAAKLARRAAAARRAAQAATGGTAGPCLPSAGTVG